MLKNILRYLEIKTKITCVLPFFMTLAYLFYLGQPISWSLTIPFFFSMFFIDLAATAINNYIDSRDYPDMLGLSRPAALWLLLALLASGSILGLYLAWRTDLVVLLTGGLCVVCGVLYTYGPIPISRQPLGEILSGIFEGVLIPFLLLYINMPRDTYLTLTLGLPAIRLSLYVKPLVTLLLFTMVPALATAGIMLANNTCDIEKDISVNRYTLPYYLGKKRAIRLFALLYVLAYLFPCLMVLLGMLPATCLLLLLTLPVVWKGVDAFLKEQKKETTFLVSIKNYILLVGLYTVCIFLGGIILPSAP